MLVTQLKVSSPSVNLPISSRVGSEDSGPEKDEESVQDVSSYKKDDIKELS